jgi:hypothetical protein
LVYFSAKESIELKALLFKTLLVDENSKHTKIPILFMMATANQTTLFVSIVTSSSAVLKVLLRMW